MSDKVDYYIGVDSDQWFELKDNRPDLAEKIATSALKQVGETLYKAVEDILDARKDNKIPDYFGQAVIWGIKENGSGLARNENYEKLVPENVRKMVDEAEQKVRDGKFKVPTAYGMSQEDVDAIKNSVKP
ncbi:hypothetical protein SDC9_191382 [bioreactor metagenome]|uniref:Uncharacterized protein n=1 Tax=bioreactor metagenome TaxID=1076179 RepID=A0A645HXR1_9ZZZZ